MAQGYHFCRISRNLEMSGILAKVREKAKSQGKGGASQNFVWVIRSVFGPGKSGLCVR